MDAPSPRKSRRVEQDIFLLARSIALSKAYPHPEMVIVEANTGMDVISADLTPTIKQIHWFSQSPTLKEAARRQLSDLDNVDFQIMEGGHLPMAESTVDGVIANLSLFNTPDPVAVIQDYVRILRPGGRLVSIFFEPGFEDSSAKRLTDPIIDSEQIKPEQIRGWLEAAGLVNIIVDDYAQNELVDDKRSTSEFGKNRFTIAVGTRRVKARQLVQESYGMRAQAEKNCCGDDSCCAPDVVTLDDLGTVHWETGYSPSELADIPGEAAEISLGCGNPVAMASLRPGEIVVDIGSGGGIDVFLAARRVGKNGFVYGIDMTDAMLERARTTAQKNGITNVEFRRGYAEALPLEAESVDVVISNCVINLSEDKGQVFSEAYRVIKPGGRLEVNDTVFGAGVLPVTRASASGWAECISGALPEGEYLDLIRQAGFRDIRVRRSTSSGISAGVPFYSIQVSAKK